MKRILGPGLGLIAIGVAFWAGTRQGANQESGSETIARPMILKQVQALGDLHSARFTFENVFEQKSFMKPVGLLAAMPGAVEVARATTGDTAVMSVDGSVEAGVDLRNARILGDRIVLPHAESYEPQVHAKVHQVRRGFFWRDDNLGLDGLTHAKERMAMAAREKGIIEEAERNALRQVQTLVASHSAEPIVVTFE